ncbi:MAG: chorismate mutase [Tistlia sp.]|uniref:chorismate mutase n=1 Tax=Tistlia sp. TaxID=3057121 RepID=UPI0034A1A16D
MAQAPATLDALRREIDEIDDAIQELLIRRTEVSRRVGMTKGPNASALRPAREAAVLRRLVARHRGSLPRAVLVRLWREIFSASLAQQISLKVAVGGGAKLAQLAREQFGVLTPITDLGSPVRAVHAVAEGEAAIAVLPLPSDGEADPWWRFLGRNGEAVPRIVARLPVAVAAAPSAADGTAALVVTLSPLEASGEDRSYLILETAEQISRSALRDWLAKAELIQRETSAWRDDDTRWLYLIEVEGFVAPDDARLTRLAGAVESRVVQVTAVGAYAVPFEDADLCDWQSASKLEARLP